jgi:hypothetical protein
MSARGNCFRCVAFESHRCRNQWIGDRPCPDGLHYEEYTGSTVKQCLYATVEMFQDGYIHCPIIEEIGCKECEKRFGDGSGFVPDDSQNYERKPRWRNESGMRNCGLPKGYEEQCCLNRSGMCTLDTADFSDIDRAVGMRGCGFIGVNDRYLLWKYDVPYKDLNCGNCGYYEAGEYSHGICKNEQVEPHTKGVTVNGEKTYIDSKECYSGAHACKEFIRKGSEIMPKRKSKKKECSCSTCGLMNKCPISNYKAIEPSETRSCGMWMSPERYLDNPFEDLTCSQCGYFGSQDRWNEGVHICHQMPLEDAELYNLVRTDSRVTKAQSGACVHFTDREEMLDAAEAERLEDEAEGRTLDVPRCCDCKHFGQPVNIDGEFVEYICLANPHYVYRLSHVNGCKLFKETPVAALSDEILDDNYHCENCAYSVDYGESVEFIKCEAGERKKDVRKKQPGCANYCPAESSGLMLPDDGPEDEEAGTTSGITSCNKQYCPLHADDKHLCAFKPTSIENDYNIYRFEIRGAVDQHDCCRQEVIDTYNSMYGTDIEMQKNHELLLTLIGKEIRTHYNTGGIVTNVHGPHNAYGPGSWTINYTVNGKKSKSPCIINSIKVENGVITCEGKPLQIIKKEETLTALNTDQNYIYRGLI